MDLAKCWVDTGAALRPGCGIVLPSRGSLTGHVALKVLRAEIQRVGVQLLYEGNGTALQGMHDEVKLRIHNEKGQRKYVNPKNWTRLNRKFTNQNISQKI